MSIKKELLSGVFYTAIAKYSGIVVSLVITAILARLIAPEDFGVVAIATVIIAFFNIFSDLGIAPAIVQNKTLLKEDLNHIFSFTIYFAIGISSSFFFCSWAIASFYDSEILVPICQLLSLNLFFATLNLVPNALLFKEKNFRFIAFRSLFIQCVGGGIAIAVALTGGGIYALLVNPIFSAILLFTVSFVKHPLSFRLHLKTEALRKIVGFSTFQFLFNLINYFSRNLDKLLIGKFMPMTSLGYYEKSYRLMMLPLQNITHVITPVMHPILSESQDDLPRLASSYERIVQILAFLGFPLSVFLFFSAKEVTLILFGEQWMPSVPCFQILALSVGVQVVLSSSGSIFQAANDTKRLFLSGALSSALNVIAILIGLLYFKTIEAVAACICSSFAINFLQAYYLLYRHTLRRPLHFFFKQLRSPLMLSALLVIVLWLLSNLCGDLSLLISLMVKGFISLLLACLYIQLSGVYNLVKRLQTMFQRKPKEESLEK